MKRIIHRANGGVYPESALEALEEMVQADAEGIEIDIQLSKDDVPMVYHDPHLGRLTGRDLFVRELSVSELKSLDVRSKSSGKGGTIPTLDEAIDIVKGKKLFYIELKKGDLNKIPETVLKVINNRLSTESFVLSSFDTRIIRSIKARDDNVRTGYIFASPLRRFFLNRTEKEVGGFDQWYVEKGMLSSRLLKKAREMNREVMVWTVNSETEMRRCIEMGVDGIITDDINRLNEVLSE